MNLLKKRENSSNASKDKNKKKWKKWKSKYKELMLSNSNI
jgi:hypothetical protein